MVEAVARCVQGGGEEIMLRKPKEHAQKNHDIFWLNDPPPKSICQPVIQPDGTERYGFICGVVAGLVAGLVFFLVCKLFLFIWV